MADVTAIILTQNEEKNLGDCLRSVEKFAKRRVVVDSGSSDGTVALARSLGAEVLEHPFENYARQFNWGVENAHVQTKWILRLDADERFPEALCNRLEKLLAAQTGERALGLCERQGVFLCRTARSGHVVAFCTQSVSQEGTIVTLQASAGFAARAALARPPFVSALEWMGSPLLPLDDLPLACRLLTAMGAQWVLVVAPQSALRHQPDALEQASGFFVPCARELGENVGVFRIPLPEMLGALSLDRILPAMDVGREAAEQGMEAALERIGMPLCRVLPFRRRLTAP